VFGLHMAGSTSNTADGTGRQMQTKRGGGSWCRRFRGEGSWRALFWFREGMNVKPPGRPVRCGFHAVVEDAGLASHLPVSKRRPSSGRWARAQRPGLVRRACQLSQRRRRPADSAQKNIKGTRGRRRQRHALGDDPNLDTPPIHAPGTLSRWTTRSHIARPLRHCASTSLSRRAPARV